MGVSFYEITIAQFISQLNILKKLIAKGQAELKDDAKIANSKLIDDM